MKKYTFIVFIYTITLLLSGCSLLPTYNFEIKSPDDKFTSDYGIYRIGGFYNRLSENTLSDNISNDYRGLYIDPYFSIDTINHKLIISSLRIINYDYKLPFGRILGILDQLTILTDKGDRIELYPKIVNSPDLAYSLSEMFVAEISFKDYLILSNAKWIELKFFGSEYTKTFNKDNILPTFLQNFRNFNKATFKYFYTEFN